MLRSGSLLSRSLALVLMLGATLTLYEFALLPLIAAHSQARTTIEQTKALLQRYQALAEQRTRLSDQVSAYERVVADADSYVPGGNDVVAAAALQDRVKSVIERAHGELRSTLDIVFEIELIAERRLMNALHAFNQFLGPLGFFRDFSRGKIDGDGKLGAP